jgi:hypothetical protein
VPAAVEVVVVACAQAGCCLVVWGVRWGWCEVVVDGVGGGRE